MYPVPGLCHRTTPHPTAPHHTAPQSHTNGNTQRSPTMAGPLRSPLRCRRLHIAHVDSRLRGFVLLCVCVTRLTWGRCRVSRHEDLTGAKSVGSAQASRHLR
eukprot:7076732-Prymnesium_polylepis.1